MSVKLPSKDLNPYSDPYPHIPQALILVEWLLRQEYVVLAYSYIYEQAWYFINIAGQLLLAPVFSVLTDTE